MSCVKPKCHETKKENVLNPTRGLYLDQSLKDLGYQCPS